MRRQRGFTLIELMIVIVIIGVLASIAFPAYTKSVQKGNRSGAEQLMLQIASQEALYFQDARSYTTALDSTGLNIPSQSPWTCTAASCTNNFYTVAVTLSASGVAPPYFIIKATVKSSSNQASDGSLFYNADASGTYSQGNKTRTTGDGKW